MSRQLPKLSDLHHNIETAFKNDDLNLLLNQSPPDSWVKDHPFIKGVRFLPIEKVEFLLTRIFQKWRREVLWTKQLFNSVEAGVRLWVLDPTDGDWTFHDGVGAVGVQTDSGKAASDLSAIKQDAVMKAAPAAISYALKDAAECFGKIFGKDLNRKNPVEFTGAYEHVPPSQSQTQTLTTTDF